MGKLMCASIFPHILLVQWTCAVQEVSEDTLHKKNDKTECLCIGQVKRLREVSHRTYIIYNVVQERHIRLKEQRWVSPRYYTVEPILLPLGNPIE